MRGKNKLKTVLNRLIFSPIRTQTVMDLLWVSLVLCGVLGVWEGCGSTLT